MPFRTAAGPRNTHLHAPSDGRRGNEEPCVACPVYNPLLSGTAKSELSRRLSSLCGGTYFERLLTRFSVPEELFGPLSMKGEQLGYVRVAQASGSREC